jgi:hypothetical protein
MKCFAKTRCILTLLSAALVTLNAVDALANSLCWPSVGTPMEMCWAKTPPPQCNCRPHDDIKTFVEPDPTSIDKFNLKMFDQSNNKLLLELRGLTRPQINKYIKGLPK